MPEKILIIDDDLDTLRLVGLMLQKQGYQIMAANNGKQGLEKIEDEIPDLVLLDVMMPEMDGYEVARRLRARPETANVPILMFTAKSQLDDKVEGFEAGVDDYLTKPTHPTELHAHVKALLSRAVKGTKSAVRLTPQGAFSIGVLGARGGLGVSSVALNLGSTLKSLSGEETIVAEMISGAGTMGRDLSFTDIDAFANLLNGEVTEDLLKETLKKHESGLRFLLASEQPKDALLNNKFHQEIEAVFTQLRKLSSFLVADFGTGLPTLSQKLLPQCHLVVVLAEALSNSIAQTKLLIEDLVELGIEKEKILVILNKRTRSDLLLSPNQVQKEVGHPISVAFTPAPELFSQAIRMDTTAVLHQPESMTAQQFKKLAGIITKKKATKE